MATRFERTLTATPFLVTGRLLDKIPEIGDPLAVAFSIRRVYTNYRGPAFRVRRSSDNQERDIAFIQTTMDEDDLLKFCSGFDGFVTVWYDQSGNDRHATQPVWDLQPQIVDNGRVIKDQYDANGDVYSGNFTVKFNGAYMTTQWEPTEAQMAGGSGIIATAKANIGIQGQTGTIRTSPAPQNVVYPNYPFEKLPTGHDKMNLQALRIPEAKNSAGSAVNVFMYHGKDGMIKLFDVDANDDINTGIQTPAGSPALTVETVPTGTAATPASTAWRKGVRGANGKVYGIPYNSSKILEIDVESSTTANRARVFDWTPADTEINVAGKWWTGVLGSDGKIYCIPYNSSRVLVIDTNTSLATAALASTADANFPGTEKWRNAVLDTTTGRIFAVPYNNIAALVISPTRNLSSSALTATVTGNFEGSGKWQDCVQSATSRFIYGIPWNAGTVLRINPDGLTPTSTVIGSTGSRLVIPDQTDDPSGGSPLNGGTGYRSPPTLSFSGIPTTGQSASGTATIIKTRIVSSITVTNGGTGYSEIPGSAQIYVDVWDRNNPMVSLTQAKARAELADDGTGTGGLKVQSITVTDCGEGFTTRFGDPLVRIYQGKGVNATAIAVVDPLDPAKRVIAIQVSGNGGSGYFTVPTIQLVGGGGSGASAEALMEVVDPLDPTKGNKIKEIRVLLGGGGYTSAPTVRITGGKGTNATATANTTEAGHVYAISVANGGTGYTVETLGSADPSPRVTVAPPPLGGVRTVARISAVEAGTGRITAITIDQGGKGYTSTPTVTILPPLGGGTTATGATASWATDGRLDDATIVNQGTGYVRGGDVTLIGGDRSPGGRVAVVAMRLEDPSAPIGMAGSAKWTAGGAGAGGIFAVPYNNHRVLRIGTDDTLSFTPLNGVLTREAKWSTGVKKDAILYGIPFNETRILRIDMDGGGIDYKGNFRGRWASASVAQNGKIYAFPAESSSILVIDTARPDESEVVSFGNIRGTGAKFSDAVITTPRGIIYGIPDRINEILELNPGVVFRSVSLPPPSVVLGDGKTVVFAPTPASGKVTKINFTNVNSVPAATQVNVANSPSYADAAVLRDGTTVVFIPYYNPNDAAEYTGYLGIFNSTSNTWSYGPAVTIDRSAPYPSTSAVTLAQAIGAGTTVAWIPRKTTAGMITYQHVGTQDSPAGIKQAATPGAQRAETSVDWASASVLADGTTVVASIPSGESAVETLNTMFSSGFRQKYIAGAVCSRDNKVYIVPARSTYLEIYDPSASNKLKAVDISDVMLPEEDSSYIDKYAGIVDVPLKNVLYGIPLRARNILVIDPTPNSNGNVDINNVQSFGLVALPEGYKWWGGVLTSAGKIVCVPYDADQILVIDPSQRDLLRRLDMTTYAVPEGLVGTSLKWRDGIVANGKVYFVPFNAPRVLEVDVETGTIDEIGSSYADTSKWAGAVLAPNGLIYCIPYTSDSVLVIDPVARTTRTFKHNLSGSWSGGALGRNGLIYCTPYSASQIMIIDPVTETAEGLGDFNTDGFYQRREKWYGVVPTRDGTMVGIPASREKYLEIKPTSRYVATHKFLDANQYWAPGPSLQREFRNKPFPISKTIANIARNFALFHTDDGYGIFDPSSNTISLGPTITNGMASLFPASIEGARDTLYSVSNVSVTSMRPFEGGVAGLRSRNGNAHLYAAIVDNDLEVGIGNGASIVQNMFDVIYASGETGVFSGMGSNGTITTYARGEPIGLGSYGYSGNDVGEFFSIGRARGNGNPIVNSQFSGYLHEVVVFSSDQTTRIADLAENQSFSYNV